MILTVTVPGRPRTQGSAKQVIDRRSGRPVLKKSPAEIAHRQLVAATVRREAAATGARWPKPAAVRLTIEAGFARPQRHYDARGNLRPGLADRPHTQVPDVDKLVRLVGDALTASGVIDDDAQITTVHAAKKWATDYYTIITIEDEK